MKRAWQEQAENHRASKKWERREGGGHNHIKLGARDAAGAMCKYTFRTVSF